MENRKGNGKEWLMIRALGKVGRRAVRREDDGR